jgi:hypothetical protein
VKPRYPAAESVAEAVVFSIHVSEAVLKTELLYIVYEFRTGYTTVTPI